MTMVLGDPTAQYCQGAAAWQQCEQYVIMTLTNLKQMSDNLQIS